MEQKGPPWANEVERCIVQDRTFVVLKPDYISNVAYFGKQKYTHAKTPLFNHSHSGIMEICYLYGGEQTFIVNNEPYHLKGGDVFITYPDEQHGTGSFPMEKSTLYWIGLDLGMHKSSFLDYKESETETLRSRLWQLQPRIFKASQLVHVFFEKVFEAYFGPSTLKKIIFRNAITELLVEVCGCAHRNPSQIRSSPITDVLMYIDQSSSKKMSLAQLSRVAGLSVPRFKKRFKEEVGIAPNEYVLRCKIEAAKRCLASSNSTITSVAYDLDFSSSQYFATVFKRFVGKTPLEFVRASRGNDRLSVWS